MWQWLQRWEQKGYLRIRSERLKWSPFLLARVKKTDGVEGRSLEEGGPGGGGLGLGMGVGMETPVTEGEASASSMTLDHHQPRQDSASVRESHRGAQSDQDEEEGEEEEAEEDAHEIRPARGRRRGPGSRSPAKARRLTRAPSSRSIRSSGRLANGSATNTPVRRLRSQRTENISSPLSLAPSGRTNGGSPRKRSAPSAKRTVTRTRARRSSTRSPRKSATARPTRRRRQKADSDAEYSEEEEDVDEASEASEASEEPDPPDSDDGDDDADETESEEEELVLTRRSRTTKGTASFTEKSSVEEDAVLAARLAAQDGPRLLRSRSATGPGNGPTTEPILKRSVSAVSATSRIMGRKRRRIESSPEPEPEDEPTQDETSQQPSPDGTTRGVNVPSLLAGSPSMSLPPPSGPPQDTDHVMEDAKSEFDSGTPYTATAHSRQSAPSDDTVIGNGDGLHVNGFGNGKGMDVNSMDVNPAVPIPVHTPVTNGHDHQHEQMVEEGDEKTVDHIVQTQAQGLNGTLLPDLSLHYQCEEGSDADAEGEPDDEL